MRTGLTEGKTPTIGDRLSTPRARAASSSGLLLASLFLAGAFAKEAINEHTEAVTARQRAGVAATYLGDTDTGRYLTASFDRAADTHDRDRNTAAGGALVYLTSSGLLIFALGSQANNALRRPAPVRGEVAQEVVQGAAEPIESNSPVYNVVDLVAPIPPAGT